MVFDLIDNDNVLFSNIGADGLHINPGGTRKFAGNLASFCVIVRDVQAPKKIK